MADYLDMPRLQNGFMEHLQKVHNVRDRIRGRSDTSKPYGLSYRRIGGQHLRREVVRVALESKQSDQEIDLLPFVRPCYDNTLPENLLRKWSPDLSVANMAKIKDRLEGEMEAIRPECCKDFLFDAFLRHLKMEMEDALMSKVEDGACDLKKYSVSENGLKVRKTVTIMTGRGRIIIG